MNDNDHLQPNPEGVLAYAGAVKNYAAGRHDLVAETETNLAESDALAPYFTGGYHLAAAAFHALAEGLHISDREAVDRVARSLILGLHAVENGEQPDIVIPAENDTENGGEAA